MYACKVCKKPLPWKTKWSWETPVKKRRHYACGEHCYREGMKQNKTKAREAGVLLPERALW